MHSECEKYAKDSKCIYTKSGNGTHTKMGKKETGKINSKNFDEIELNFSHFTVHFGLIELRFSFTFGTV